jgi:hypothetical protein
MLIGKIESFACDFYNATLIKSIQINIKTTSLSNFSTFPSFNTHSHLRYTFNESYKNIQNQSQTILASLKH